MKEINTFENFPCEFFLQDIPVPRNSFPDPHANGMILTRMGALGAYVPPSEFLKSETGGQKEYKNSAHNKINLGHAAVFYSTNLILKYIIPNPCLDNRHHKMVSNIKSEIIR